jgi:hypothetical protein
MMDDGNKTLSADWEQSLRELGVIQEFSPPDPHVMYEGGKVHSDFSFNVNALIANQILMTAVLRALLQEWSKAGDLPDAVCSHTPYGGPLAEAMAKIAGTTAYTFRSESSTWERAGPPAGSKCLIMGDDVLTGGRLTALVNQVRSQSAIVLKPLIVLADLSSQWQPGLPVLRVIRRVIPLWTADDCPLCRSGSIPRRRVDLVGFQRP